MNMNRRDFLKLAGAAAAVPLAGMSSEADISGLPDEWARKFKSCKMDEHDKAILESMIRAGKTTDKDLQPFQSCLSNPLWSKLDGRFKKSIANSFKTNQVGWGAGVRGSGIYTDKIYVTIYFDRNHMGVAPLIISPDNVYGWFERSERTQDYIVLADTLFKSLSSADRAWAERLLFVVNDNLHPLLTAPYAVPTRQEFANGSVNGKAMCSVGGIFPTRCELNASKEQAAELWNRDIDALNRILIKRGIPQEMRDMYHKVGYVYILSDLEGEKMNAAFGDDCKLPIHSHTNPSKLCSISIDLFLNAITPIPDRAAAFIKDFEPAQRERRKNARKNLQATLSDLSREKDLSAGRKKVLDAVLSQLSRVREPRQAALVAQKRAAISNADFAHTRGGDE